MSKGFTLLELSIVLVIIGLIIGGIVAGRELIKAAEISSGISELRQFDVAAQAFRLKYNAMPGDIANAVDYELHLNEAGVNVSCSTGGSTTYNGDGDGVIESYNVRSGGGTTVISAEISNYFIHLSNTGLIQQTIIGNKTTSSWCAGSYLTAGMHYPTFSIGEGIIKLYDVNSNSYYYVIGGMDKTHHYSVQHSSAATRFSDILPPETASAVDNKIDDGKALSGSVRAASSINGYRGHPTLTRGYITIDDADSATNCVYNGDYNLQYAEKSCTLLVKAAK